MTTLRVNERFEIGFIPLIVAFVRHECVVHGEAWFAHIANRSYGSDYLYEQLRCVTCNLAELQHHDSRVPFQDIFLSEKEHTKK